jgi:predicted RNase H-like HicB family nuclease
MAFTAIIEKEGRFYVARAAELDVTSQGESLEESVANLKEAIELYLEHADPEELEAIQKRQASLFISPIEIGRPHLTPSVRSKAKLRAPASA